MDLKKRFKQENKMICDIINKNGYEYYDEVYVQWLEGIIKKEDQEKELMRLSMIEYLNKNKK